MSKTWPQTYGIIENLGLVIEGVDRHIGSLIILSLARLLPGHRGANSIPLPHCPTTFYCVVTKKQGQITMHQTSETKMPEIITIKKERKACFAHILPSFRF